MKWTIEYSKNTVSFLKNNQSIEENIINEIKKVIQKLQGQTVNINLKKLSGEWEGYYRIRKGKIRIIIYLDFLKRTVYVENVDFRGNIYT